MGVKFDHGVSYAALGIRMAATTIINNSSTAKQGFIFLADMVIIF